MTRHLTATPRDDLDVCHLTFLPPTAPGSYNRFVGVQVSELTDLRQTVVSYRSHTTYGQSDSWLILVDDRDLSLSQKALLALPERIRKVLFKGIASHESLAYLWQILSILPRLKPKLIICYDNYKFGHFLRSVVSWPARLILSQHGHSYFLPSDSGTQIYGLDAFDAVVTLTQSAYRFERHRLLAYESTVAVIPNGVDTRRFTPPAGDQRDRARKRWGIRGDKLVVLILARLIPRKGAHVIIQAWPQILKEVPEAFLWIVGEGHPDYRAYLASLVRNLGISESVRFEGFVKPTDTPSCFHAADLYAFPVLWAEGQGLSLLEAMSSGLPCVASDTPSVSELYPDTALTLVGNPNVEDAFVEPLVTALREPARRKLMGQAARATVEERFSQTRALDSLMQFYRRQLSFVGH